MISQEQNDLITLTGAGTPCGKLMRRYWQPAALVDELDGARKVVPVRLLGEDLVVFKTGTDDQGNATYGMLRRDCPHRGADLAYGRVEQGGLRCAFHGWKFDASGQCVDTPAEPVGSGLCARIRQPAYPVRAAAGILWAWLGEGEAPEMPMLDCLAAPDTHVFAFKGLWDCNWLQALEVGIDPAHASFLHRFFHDEDTKDSYGKQFRAASTDSDLPMTFVLREYDRPIINVETTEYGLRLIALREIDAQRTHVRVTNQVFPHGFCIPLSNDMTITQWHVPVDDHTCYWYAAFTSFTAPVDKDKMRAQRLAMHEGPQYRSRRNRDNEYGFNPHEQEHDTYTGMGTDINVHDQWAVESMGRIQDRTREHLGSTDKGIIAYRRMLRDQIKRVEAGETPMMTFDSRTRKAVQGPATMDGIGPTQGWELYWMEVDVRRRRNASWAAEVPKDIAEAAPHLLAGE